jgi:hypothetical protein
MTDERQICELFVKDCPAGIDRLVPQWARQAYENRQDELVVLHRNCR